MLILATSTCFPLLFHRFSIDTFTGPVRQKSSVWRCCLTAYDATAPQLSDIHRNPINVLIIIVIGAICFYLIDRFVRDGRLGNLLKILVALFCLAAILQRILPMLGVNS